MKNIKNDTTEDAAMEEAWERSAMPHPRDILKREHDEAQKRPRDVAWEKWGPMIEEAIERDLERMRKHPAHPELHDSPDMDGPDLDME